VWKPLTYQFLHGGLSHLFWNMLLLFFFGPGLERTVGSRRFLRFYVVCGAVAVLANLIPDFLSVGALHRFPSVTGASGAVMGVVVAFVLIDLDREYLLFPFPVPVNGRALLLILVVINVLYALMQTNVSVATHFGGMAFGYVYMRLLPAYNRWARERRVRARPAPPAPPGEEDEELGKIIDNILKFKDKEWK
ncbi:MAG TPA: rhomboid family intramembrane serine protease, partial [Candidatus Hydrogenedentes bacterium]|nr:rhomboid family intramembrane serine protease [Candidatus Hydrogenedentota bacterium]